MQLFEYQYVTLFLPCRHGMLHCNIMIIKQLYLDGFSHHLCGSAPRSCSKSLENAAGQLGGLSRLAGRFFAPKLLAPSAKSRNRHFPTMVVFWAFLSQVLTRNASCRAALSSVQAWAAARKKAIPSNNTGAYCQARARLSLETLRGVFNAVGSWIERRCEGQMPLLAGRVVRVIDGTGITMPDSPQNRKKWPYASNQKPGCGFPAIKLVGMFCLRTGRMVKFAFDCLDQSEFVLARQLVGWVKKGEVVLADRGFCSWGLIALFQRKGVDVVMRLHHLRKDKAGTSIWPKRWRSGSWSRTLWGELPEKLVMRIIAFEVHVKGFRTRRIKLCTTLLNAKDYPDEALIELYMRRWKIELYLRDIKVTLGLDVLRCLSPEMVEKEIWMQAIAHNLVRALMLEAAMTHGVALERLSFKGTVDMMRTWAGWMHHDKPGINRELMSKMLLAIAADQVPWRPLRSEPRVQKRRPKDYPYLTKPRHKLDPADSRRKR